MDICGPSLSPTVSRSSFIVWPNWTHALTFFVFGECSDLIDKHMWSYYGPLILQFVGRTQFSVKPKFRVGDIPHYISHFPTIFQLHSHCKSIAPLYPHSTPILFQKDGSCLYRVCTISCDNIQSISTHQLYPNVCRNHQWYQIKHTTM